MKHAIILKGLFGSYTIMWGPISYHGTNDFDGEFVVFDGTPEWYDSSGDEPMVIWKTYHRRPFAVLDSEGQCALMVEQLKQACEEQGLSMAASMDGYRDKLASIKRGEGEG